MSKEWKVAVIGGDKRSEYMVRFLQESGYVVMSCVMIPSEPEEVRKIVKWADVLVGPTPFSRDGVELFHEKGGSIFLEDFAKWMREGQILFGGNISPSISQEAEQKRVQYHDFMAMDEVARDNAVATAEGAIAEAITVSDINLDQSNCLVLGFGRCGKAIYERLTALGAKCSLGLRNAAQKELPTDADTISLEELPAHIQKFDFIFNTIPAKVLTRECVSKMKKDCVIIDIASKPGGTDFEACRERGIYASLSLGIPGRYAPKTSAQILVNAMNRRMEA